MTATSRGFDLGVLCRGSGAEALALASPELPELDLDAEDLERNLFDDPDHDPGLCLCARLEGRLAGLACGVARGPRGYMKLLVVEPAQRQRGIGGCLLRELESRLRARGVEGIQVDGAAPVYLLPGLQARAGEGRRFLAARGYSAGEERASMVAALEGLDLDTRAHEAALAPQVLVRRAAASDTDLLRSQVGELFSRDWAVELEFALRRRPPAAHIALAGDRLAGFAAAGVWARNAFGPMGTAPGHERRGIGEVLLKRSLADLRDAGCKQALIPWVGPEAFYARKAGARTVLAYEAMIKRF